MSNGPSEQHEEKTMWRGLTLSCALVGLAAFGVAPQEKAAVPGVGVIAARQASLDMSSITFRSMGDAMKAGREAKSQAYPAIALEKWAKSLPTMFPPGTAQGETSAESQALSDIWQDRAGFDRAAANYADATAKLAALATANDTIGFTKQLEEVNSACNSCHARYKSGAQGAPRK
jgi:cytochrome c556